MAVVACALPALRPVTDPDVWWHLAAGRDLLSGGEAAFRDNWSFTAAGATWINHEWLAEAILAFLHALFGDPGLTLLAIVLLGGTALLLFRAATRDDMPPFVAAALIALVAAASSDRFVPRPQLFSYLGLAFLLDRLGAARHTGRIPWEIVPAQVAWSNAHGAVPGLLFGGFLILGGALPALPLGGRLRLYGTLILASMVHPQGILPLWDNATHLAGGGLYRSTVREWLPLFDPLQKSLPQAAATWALCGVALAGTIAALRRRGIVRRAGPLLLLLLAGLAPIAAVRNRDLAGLLLAPLLAFLGPGAARLLHARGSTLLAATAALALIALPAAGVGRYPSILPFRPGLSTTLLPRSAVAFLKRERPGSRIFNVYDHGGYLIHELGPAHRVFIDGRYFVYGEARYREYLELRDGASDAASRLEARGADLLLLRYPAADGYMALARVVRDWPDWRLVYWDDDMLLYARLGAASATWLDAHAYLRAHPLETSARISDPDWWRTHFGTLVRECLRACDEAPEAIRPRLTLALALDYSGRDSQAAQVYHEALRLSPGCRPAREGLERLGDRNPGGIPTAPTLAQLRREAGVDRR